MLGTLRQAASGWVSKVLLILLVVSFGIWGVSGQFAGYGAGTVANVGTREVTAAEFQRTMQSQLQAISAQSGNQFTMDQARSLGIPQQVLGQLIAEAAVDHRAADMNLGVSEDRLAQLIAADRSFHGINGRFDRDRFQSLLRNADMREDDYIRDVRDNVVRQQIAGAVSGGIKAPQPLVDALYRFQNEERTVSFLVVDETAIEPVGEPDPAALQSFFDSRREQFRAPEYRKLAVLSLDPKAVVAADAISEPDVEAEYQRRLAADFTRPERRRVEQIRFDTREAAEQAAATGGDFLEIAKSRNMAPTDIDLGMKTKAEIVDPAVAEAAFAAAPNAVVPVLDGRLGPALVRVTAVEPAVVTPLPEAAAGIRQSLAERQGREKALELYNQIEDQRAGGATLEEISKALSVPYRFVDGVSRDGRAMDGTVLSDLPGQAQLLAGAFESDVGVENDAIRLGEEGYVFYDVTEIVPERERTLDEARADVVAAWRADEIAARIGARTEEFLARLRAGETIQALAQSLGKTAATADGVKRGQPAPGLSQNAVAQAFAGPEGHSANAEADAPPARILLHVDRVTIPAFFAEAESARRIKAELDRALQADVFRSFNAQVLQTLDTRINNPVFAQLTGEPAAN